MPANLICFPKKMFFFSSHCSNCDAERQRIWPKDNNPMSTQCFSFSRLEYITLFCNSWCFNSDCNGCLTNCHTDPTCRLRIERANSNGENFAAVRMAARTAVHCVQKPALFTTPYRLQSRARLRVLHSLSRLCRPLVPTGNSVWKNSLDKYQYVEEFFKNPFGHFPLLGCVNVFNQKLLQELPELVLKNELESLLLCVKMVLATVDSIVPPPSPLCAIRAWQHMFTYTLPTPWSRRKQKI